ncbi:AAA family ATPase [Alkalicoccobacillus porphyridii]|uniref:Nuclease SbcCD subunit C n=1 Tax=Alkalicoccobacillus porphyridii TaxID=2597270 RepID=A0A553ZYI9_9BACI|nr:AAA family ATPase [Alkalicoccobacillus porphyridii]TSB46475.1 AAA family ATPase [Alkalicoccobacillus porphyridii]
MANIASVRLENFQSHLDSEFSFTDGLNVLIGQSDSGKTAVIRGIRWALFNQPRGTDFIRAGSDFVRVTIRFDNGDTLIRERTASKNRYMTEKQGEERQIYESFGNQVPEEVLDLHHMRPLKIDRDHELTIHLAQQLDGPFLLEQAGSMRAKTIGRISGAHYIDAAIRETSRDLSSLNQSKKWSEEQTEQLKVDLEPFKDIEKMGETLQHAFNQVDELKRKQLRLEQLLKTSSSLQVIHAAKETTERQLKSVEQLPRMEFLFQSLQLTSLRYTSLKKQKLLLETHQQQWSKVQHHLKKTEALDQMNQAYNQSDEMQKKTSKLRHLHHQYTKMIQIKEKAQKVKNQTHFIQEIDVDWQDRLKHLEQRRQQFIVLHDRLIAMERQVRDQENKKQSFMQSEQAREVVDEISTKLQSYQWIKAKQLEYKEVNRRLKDGQQFVESKKSELTKLQAEYDELIKKDGVCPTCGQVIQQNHSH